MEDAQRERLASYLATLLSRIEREKRYPRAARRRGIQGKVDSRFELDCKGRISGLRLRSKEKMLRGATRRAIEAARPLPAPPPGVPCPMPVHFVMEFLLR
ncbi:MAG TPA: TonB family protein [Sedimenticola sp.]|nr:TonB family protein [Sedimenticola sp.]